MHVNTVGQILEELQRVLAGIEQATSGKATPLWRDLQTQWQGHYAQMSQGLASKHQASAQVHATFVEGDHTGARIMMG
ncbi:hypothetical protein GCM10022267_75670 [Lentzea roselyniae]|uniref:WXG100 family type VII secretion target n=2 Tax=Lentzea roselyniae TaxID=531940 RepID=A0ABP7C628_9PSEU